jgi:hypothetical protein
MSVIAVHMNEFSFWAKPLPPLNAGVLLGI